MKVFKIFLVWLFVLFVVLGICIFFRCSFRNLYNVLIFVFGFILVYVYLLLDYFLRVWFFNFWNVWRSLFLVFLGEYVYEIFI